MTQRGVVRRRLGAGKVEVLVKRVSACSHDCDSCAGCGSMVKEPELTAVAQDAFGAQVGQKVTVETESSRVLGLAALIYLLPFVGLFGAYVLVANRLTEGPAALVSVGCFFLVLLGVCLPLDRYLRRHKVSYRVVGVEGQ